MATAIGYVRVSSAEQAESGLSLEAQEKRVRAYAELYGLTLVDVIVDAGVSAKTLERPGLERALGMLRSGAATGLVVAKLDRLTRSVKDLGELVETYFEDGKWALMSVSENIDTRSASGRLILNILASVAQWEREAIGERTSAALQEKKSRGERVGSVPYGYVLGNDGKLQAVPEEQGVILEARRLREEGLSLRDVSQELALGGKVSRGARPFTAEQVRRMVAA
jgi:DNA invertase Pin-like site-specific DNA recombinase